MTLNQVRVLLFGLAGGLAIVCVLALGTSTRSPAPESVRAFSISEIPTLLGDLHEGKEVRIVRSPADGKGSDGSEAATGPGTMNRLRGFGPLPSYARRRLLGVYQEGIDSLVARSQAPRESGTVADVLAEASDLALLEEFRAKQAVVLADGAFFVEYETLPSWPGWRVLAEQNQTLVVDGDGNPIAEPAQFQGDKASVVSRRLPVLVPIDLSKHPVLDAALAYRRNLEIAATQERIDAFNALSFEQRSGKLQEHIRARAAISALGGTSMEHQEAVDNLAKHLLDVPFVDRTTLLARMKK